MSDPFVVDGTLTYSDEDGLAAEPHGFSYTGSFTVEAKFKYTLVGSSTKTVNFGSVLLAKAFLITVDYNALAAVVYAQFNGGATSGQLQIAPGGGIMYWNPVPIAGGVASLILTHTTDAIARVRVLG